jgi:leader peptidase (prepilin peptidase)/N-methyltransferase
LDPLLLTAQFWRDNQGLLITGVVMLSLVVGSFLNVVILRLPVMMDRSWREDSRALLATPPIAAAETNVSLVHPPSSCPHCGHRIRPHENVPVLSYVLLRGRCGNCREPISPRYPIVELLTAVLSVIVVLRLGIGWPAVAGLVLTWALVTLTVIDLDHQLLPDSITLPLLWAGLAINSGNLFIALDTAVWGAIAGYLSLWSVYWGFRLITGKEGMGFGDFKLLAALGAWVGWIALPTVILLSSLVGACVGLFMVIVRGKDKSIPIPFGPYLAAAGWLTLLYGDEIRRAYLSLMVG